MANKPSSLWCPAPTKSIVIKPTGDVAPCCSYNASPYLANEVDFSDKETIYQLFDETDDLLQQNSIPLNCQRCFKTEDQGLTSKRLKLIKTFTKNQFNFKDKNKEHAEICFSNFCNLNCIMCNSLFSTKWVKTHEQIIESTNNSLLADFHKSYQKKHKSFELSKEQVKYFVNLIDGVKTIEILGGEPLLYKHFIYFLELVKQNSVEPSTIEITTNFTNISDELIETMKSFVKTRFHFILSIDHTYKNYEFIRGTSFDRIRENIRKLLEHFPKTKIFVNPTYGTLNLSSFIDIVDWIKETNIENFKVSTYNFLCSDEPLSLISASDDFREYHIKRLQNWSLYDEYQAEINDIVAHIKSYPKEDNSYKIAALETINFFKEKRKIDIFEIDSSLKMNFS